MLSIKKKAIIKKKAGDKIMNISSDVLDQISDIVTKLREHFRNRDPFFLARQLNIECVFCDLSEILAFSERSSIDDPGTIYISNSLCLYSQKILCAHELGHLLLHKDDDNNLFSCEFNPLKEYEANYFAAHLLPQIIVYADITKMSVDEFNSYITSRVMLSTNDS